jgi:hypothetical protein
MVDHWERIDLSEFLNSNKIGFLGGKTGDAERDATRRWATCDRALICQRYDRIAPFIALFDWALFLPSGLRKRAVDRLKLGGVTAFLKSVAEPEKIFRFCKRPWGPAGGFMESTCLLACCARREDCAGVSAGPMSF